MTATRFGSVDWRRGLRRGIRGTGKDGDGDGSCAVSRLRFVVGRIVSACEVIVLPRPRRRPEDRCCSLSDGRGIGVLGGSFLTLRFVETRSVRCSDAKDARDCDLLSEAMAEEVVLPPRLRRAGRPVRPDFNFSDLTFVVRVDSGRSRADFFGFRVDVLLPSRSSILLAEGDSGSLRGLTSRSGRTGLVGRRPLAMAALGVHGVEDPEGLARCCRAMRLFTGVDAAEADCIC